MAARPVPAYAQRGQQGQQGQQGDPASQVDPTLYSQLNYTPGQLGYSHGQAFGDPSKFTKSTGSDEIDRFNQFLRSQPFWQNYTKEHSSDGKVSLDPQQQQQLEKLVQSYGIPVAEGQFEIDEAGNLHEKSWREQHPTAYGGLITAAEIGASMVGSPALGAAVGAIGEGYARDPKHPSLTRAALGGLSGYAGGGGFSGASPLIQQGVRMAPSVYNYAKNPSLANLVNMGVSYGGQYLPGNQWERLAERQGLSVSERALMGQSQGAPQGKSKRQVPAYAQRG